MIDLSKAKEIEKDDDVYCIAETSSKIAFALSNFFNDIQIYWNGTLDKKYDVHTIDCVSPDANMSVTSKDINHIRERVFKEYYKK